MRIISFAVLIMVLNILGTWLINLPQDVGADVPEGKLNSLSFSPFRAGQGPLLGIFPTPVQIEADLKLISQKTHNIRTYASAEGNMQVIPDLAKKYGLTMLQGAWLQGVWIPNFKEINKKEIDELIHSANAHPDVVKRVIVGNEVLLRGDLSVDQLIEYIREVKRSIKQPVSYADVWSMYMQHPQLIKEVDFITIHILPYWEDRPINSEEAAEHIERVVQNVQKQANSIAPNKPILIGESGWPSAGRQRGGSVPSVVNGAKFIRALIKVAKDNGFDYNIVEAFNQPWKNVLEGVVGANWGLYTTDRQEVFPLMGKVYENPKWSKGLTASIIIFLIVSLRYWQSLQSLSTTRLLFFLVFLQILSVLLVSQMEYIWHSRLQLLSILSINHIETIWHINYSSRIQPLQTLLIIALNMLSGGFILRRAYALLANQETSAKLGSYLYRLYGLFVVFALYQTYQMAVDGRYLSFPTIATYIPVFGLAGLMLIRSMTESESPWTWQTIGISQLLGDIKPKVLQNKLMGGALLLIGLALIIGETHAFIISHDLIDEQPDFWIRLRVCLGFTLTNCQLLAWLASLTVLAIPFLISDNKTAEVL